MYLLTSSWEGGGGGSLCVVPYSCSTMVMHHRGRLYIVALERPCGPLTAVPALSGRRLTGLGDQPTWPCPCPGMGHTCAFLPTLHPLPDSDRGMVWYQRCVYMPLECSHGPNLCSRGGGGAHPYISLARPHKWWVVVVGGMVIFPLSCILQVCCCLLGVRAEQGRTASQYLQYMQNLRHKW